MIIKQLILKCLGFYKRWISPVLPPACRFYPTCSDYSFQAIEKYGVIKGVIFALKRLVRCHPMNLGGYDPVP